MHIRTNPYKKTLFVRGEGFDAEYPFAYGNALENAGVEVYDTTEWGHDATEDGSFFVYYRAGTVNSVNGVDVSGYDTGWLETWPGNEWEFKLDGDPESSWTPVSQWRPRGTPDALKLSFAYSSLKPSGNYNYRVRMPLPPVSVLVVIHHKTIVSSFGSPDGSISFVPSYTFKPGPEHPKGYRYWNWSAKGISTPKGQARNYGLAITLQIPLDRYFGDRPYSKGRIWTGSGWREPDPENPMDMRLAPLSECEDFEDKGSAGDEAIDLANYDGGTYSFWMTPPGSNVAEEVFVLKGNARNGLWDGDRRLTYKEDWVQGDLNPFDIDNNGLVELPAADDPDNIPSSSERDISGEPYTKARVLRHTILHEIIHALAGAAHAKDADSLFADVTQNWTRDHYLDNETRSRLVILNERRYFQNP